MSYRLGFANSTLHFDMQKVLTTPKTQVSNMYYTSKINVYNFTIYNLLEHSGICNLWNETIAERGSNEISSILMKCFLDILKKCPQIKEIRTFSDNCSGQFKNKQMFTMLGYVAVRQNIKIVHR